MNEVGTWKRIILISWMLLFRWRCKLVLCFCYFTPNTKLLKIPAYKTEKQATLSLNHCTNDVHNITGDWRLEVCTGRCLGGHCDAVWRMVTGTLWTLERNQAEAATLQSLHTALRHDTTSGILMGSPDRMVTGTLRTLQRNQAEAATLQTTAH